jgi:hypothetical protein
LRLLLDMQSQMLVHKKHRYSPSNSSNKTQDELVTKYIPYSTKCDTTDYHDVAECIIAGGVGSGRPLVKGAELTRTRGGIGGGASLKGTLSKVGISGAFR